MTNPVQKKKTQQSTLHSFFGATKSVIVKNDLVPESTRNKNTGKDDVSTNDNKDETTKIIVDGATKENTINAPDTNPNVKRKSPSTINQSLDDNRISKQQKSVKAVGKRRVIDDSDSEQEDETIEEKPKFDESKNVENYVSEFPDQEPTKELIVDRLKEECSTEVTKESTTKVESDVGSKNILANNEQKNNTKKHEVSVKNTKTLKSVQKTGDSNKKGVSTKLYNESKVNTNNDRSKQQSSHNPVSSILKAAIKDQHIKSDNDILENIPDTWENAMPYSVLCRAFSAIEEISSRLQIQEILTTLFRQIILKQRDSLVPSSSTDLHTVLYLASNSVAPAYECVELGIGDAILVKAIGEATGNNPSMVKQKYENDGDLGTVAQTFKSKQRTLGGFFTKQSSSTVSKKNYLTAEEVLLTFRKIAATKGNQSQKFKVDSIKKLLVQASDPEETKYIIRGLQGKLRIGLAQSTVLISLAHALALTIPSSVQKPSENEDDEESYPSEAEQYMSESQPYDKRLECSVAIVKKAYSEVPSYDAILEAALKVPLQYLHKACSLTPGIPVAPMLAKPTKSVQEVLKRLNGLKFTVEFKYDGERAQIHMLPDGTTKVFSRNLLDTSEKYPEVPLFVKEACQGVQSFVLDAEVVAFNNKTGQLVPFQILSTRKKTEESAETAKVQVIVHAFDLMYLNGESLLGKTLEQRRSLMKKHFIPVEGKFQYAKSLDHEENGDTAVIEEFLELAVKGQCEGLMVKTLEVNAIYEPSRRSLNWLKLKKDYLEGLGDSVDLVPLGAYHGRGKRTGVYGAYLLACYDPETEEFQSVCKIGTGFSDDDLQSLSENLNKHKIPNKSTQYNVSDQLECDVWFDAVQVWEVKAADLSKSSAHRGAVGKTGEAGRGIGLRFPRFERIREDKKPDDATTSDQILEMYYQQDALGAGVADDEHDDDGI